MAAGTVRDGSPSLQRAETLSFGWLPVAFTHGYRPLRESMYGRSRRLPRGEGELTVGW
ncbi:hypothetical protein [Halorientalis sp.]|uniref:hypothetical protein n=1 Tax=Halorientalis sp. TaxID=1931229 RepID=UPI0026312DE9|nr:hypothetical protein [Halorientalis sp.]